MSDRFENLEETTWGLQGKVTMTVFEAHLLVSAGILIGLVMGAVWL